MARFTVSSAALALLATSTITSAGPPKPTPPGQAAKSSDQVLMDGLNAAAASSSGQQVSPQTKSDDGPPNPSPVAVSKVCSHDNPSAERSRICQPNSPP
jgi:hypothetical protein